MSTKTPRLPLRGSRCSSCHRESRSEEAHQRQWPHPLLRRLGRLHQRWFRASSLRSLHWADLWDLVCWLRNPCRPWSLGQLWPRLVQPWLPLGQNAVADVERDSQALLYCYNTIDDVCIFTAWVSVCLRAPVASTIDRRREISLLRLRFLLDQGDEPLEALRAQPFEVWIKVLLVGEY